MDQKQSTATHSGEIADVSRYGSTSLNVLPLLPTRLSNEERKYLVFMFSKLYNTNRSRSSRDIVYKSNCNKWRHMGVSWYTGIETTGHGMKAFNITQEDVVI